MKKNYSSPVLDIQAFSTEDTITASSFLFLTTVYDPSQDKAFPEINVDNDHFKT